MIFGILCSGESYDNMIVANQKTQFEDVNDHRFTHVSYFHGTNLMM